MVTISLNNHRTEDAADLFVMLTAAANTNGKGYQYEGELPLNSWIALPTFNKKYPRGFNITSISSGRFYVSYGPADTLPDAPVPNSPQYYGYFELSTDDNNTAWIDLTNVDQVALPIAISGTDESGNDFSLGYKIPNTTNPENPIQTKTLLDELKQNALENERAVITCKTGTKNYSPEKIVSPSNMPGSYASYDKYLNSLFAANAALSITSDSYTDEKGNPVSEIFTGNFSAESKSIELTGNQDDKISIPMDQLTSEIIYQCAGGTFSFNGITVEDNMPTPNDVLSPAQTIFSNSTFRNIMIGLNEGYFSAGGTNNSASFPCMSPFANGGNVYAEIIHKYSNSYGYPYADSNLKVLLQEQMPVAIQVTIMTDTEAYGYSGANNTVQPIMPPNTGFSFGIGTNSSLGIISMNNGSGCAIYTPSSSNAYGGNLPLCPGPEYTPLHFSTGGYILIQTVEATKESPATFNYSVTDANGNPCLIFITKNTNSPEAAPVQILQANGLTTLAWPANVMWNPNAESAANTFAYASPEPETLPD